jgi:aminomethyltransferase
MQLQFQSWRSHELEVAQSVAFVPSFEIFADASVIAELSSALRSSGTANASPEALEQLRILSGTPLYGVDIRDKDLPQETNQTRALHFSKGCYLGQEIVERIRSRGAVHRTFTGFILHGDLPPAGTILSADDKPVGELTSVTSLNLELIAHSSQLSETSPLQIALGYIRREALERNAIVTYPGGTATAASLPFQLPELRALNV